MTRSSSTALHQVHAIDDDANLPNHQAKLSVSKKRKYHSGENTSYLGEDPDTADLTLVPLGISYSQMQELANLLKLKGIKCHQIHCDQLNKNQKFNKISQSTQATGLLFLTDSSPLGERAFELYELLKEHEGIQFYLRAPVQIICSKQKSKTLRLEQIASEIEKALSGEK